MDTPGKRTIQVNVKMTVQDFQNLRRASEVLWPDAVISNSGILLGLARIAAKNALEGKPRKRAAKSQ